MQKREALVDFLDVFVDLHFQVTGILIATFALTDRLRDF
jgi:hypothetical protein